MARIQQSIEVQMPVHVVYNQLTQFEDYPQFMDDVESVLQVDETRLHWTTIMSNRPVEWDAEIIEQEPDRCIEWHNVSGPTNKGRLDVEAVGDDAARVTMTLDAQPEQVPGSPAGDSAPELEQKLRMDLARLKTFIEQNGGETGAWRGEVHGAQLTRRDRDARQQERQAGAAGSAPGGDPQGGRGSPRNAPVPMESYAAGSEGWSGDEEDLIAPTDTARQAAPQRDDRAGVAAPQVPRSTQSDYALSQGDEEAEEDGRFSVAEEVSFDEQSSAMRHVGQLPDDNGSGAGAAAAEALGDTMVPGERGVGSEEAELRRKLDKNLPPPQ